MFSLTALGEFGERLEVCTEVLVRSDTHRVMRPGDFLSICRLSHWTMGLFGWF
jgi:hypothetical protein